MLSGALEQYSCWGNSLQNQASSCAERDGNVFPTFLNQELNNDEHAQTPKTQRTSIPPAKDIPESSLASLGFSYFSLKEKIMYSYSISVGTIRRAESASPYTLLWDDNLETNWWEIRWKNSLISKITVLWERV